MFPKKHRNDHRIGEVSFRRGHLACRCQWTAEPDSPAGLALQYQRHRREVGLVVAAGMGGSQEAPTNYTIRRTRRHK